MGMVSRMQDARLVARALRRDGAAFGELVRRHVPAVSAIAMAYMRNGTDADDVIQDAFIKAWQSLDTLRTPRRFGGWMATIARTTALKQLGRKRHESESLDIYRTEAVMANAPTLNETHEAMRELLPALVAALPERDRELVLLRYYAGKKTRDIAEMLGDSHAAVRKRLERTRRALGDALLASIVPDAAEQSLRERYANRVASAAVAVVPEWTQGAVHAAAASTAPAAMKLLGAVVAAVVVATVGIVLTLPERVPNPSMTAALAAPSEKAVADPVYPVVSAPPETPQADAPMPTIAAESNGARIGGRLIEETSGAGVEDAEIELNANGMQRAVRTDANGSYAFDGLGAGEFWIDLAWDDALCRRFPRSRYARQEQRVRLAKDTSVMDVNFAVLGGVTVRGRVVRATGAPLEGAVVEAWTDPNVYEAKVRTDAKGEFAFSGFGTDLPAYFWPHHDGDALPPHGPVTIPANGLNDLVLTMGSESSIAGVLTDQEGIPLPDVQVWAWPEGITSLSECSTTDSAGRFEAHGLHASTYHFTITFPGESNSQRLDDANTIMLAEGEHVRDVQLVCVIPGDLTISGRITDDQGSPQRNVRVWTSRGNTNVTAETDREGNYSLPGLEPGTYILTAQDVSWQGPAWSTSEAEAGDANVDFVFARPGAVRGVVLDASTSQPIPQFEVMCPGPAMRWTAFRNADGAFELHSLRVVDTVTLAARAEGYASGISEELTLTSGEARENVVIRLERSGRITGRVIAPDGALVRDAQVGIDDGMIGEAAQTDAGGEFEVANARPGTWLLRAWHSDYAPGETQVRVVSGEALRVDVRLQKGGRISGTLRLGDVALHGQQLELTQWLGEHVIGYNRQCTTGEDGSFEFAGVPRGALMLHVNPMMNGQGRVLDVPVSMGHHETKVVDLDLFEGLASAEFDIDLDDALRNRDGHVNVELEYSHESGDVEKFYTFARIGDPVRLESLRPGPATMRASYYASGLNAILATMEPIDIIVEDNIENRFTLVLEPEPQP